MRQAEYTAIRTGVANEEFVEVLTAISVVSMRLARKLTACPVRVEERAIIIVLLRKRSFHSKINGTVKC
ncbi:MAG: hypothetical protein Q4E35_01360 [Eubacteriales bacterium]|nr:hypothetical protein [Eubacteriales bacterium]